LGQAVQRLRKEREISQEGLALLSGVDRSYMGRIERGDNNVAVLTLLRVASALELTVCELMAEAGL
jgi:transcriptional regulator with XRE-family HTH domain